MAPSGSKTKLKAAELEAAIMKKLAERPECAGIVQVYIKPTGEEPPQETWTHTLISRRANVPRTAMETKLLHDVLNEMGNDFDLIPS